MAGKYESIFPKHAKKYINFKYTSLEEGIKENVYSTYLGESNMETARLNPAGNSHVYPVQF